jgi:hypothetical protein
MHGKSLFLHRAVSRTDQWGPQFPPSPWHAVNPTLSGGRQLAVAVTDARGLRCAVFTSFGAILEFRASWDELERAGTWWHYARAWHFWFVDDLQSARRVFPTDSGQIVVASSESSDTSNTSTDSLLSLIRVAELRASRD